MRGDDNDDMCTRLNHVTSSSSGIASHIYKYHLIQKSTISHPRSVNLNTSHAILMNIYVETCRHHVTLLSMTHSIPHISLHDSHVTKCLYEHAMCNPTPIDAIPSLVFDSDSQFITNDDVTMLSNLLACYHTHTLIGMLGFHPSSFILRYYYPHIHAYVHSLYNSYDPYYSFF